MRTLRELENKADTTLKSQVATSNKDLIIEEIKEESKEPLIDKKLNHVSHSTDLSLKKDKSIETGKIIFTTNRKDKDNYHIKGGPIAFVAPNISSYAGGNANLWRNSYNMNGLKNPYGKKKAKEPAPKM
jgi:hypothetical protein